MIVSWLVLPLAMEAGAKLIPDIVAGVPGAICAVDTSGESSRTTISANQGIAHLRLFHSPRGRRACSDFIHMLWLQNRNV
jgi:hypothetical protein